MATEQINGMLLTMENTASALAHTCGMAQRESSNTQLDYRIACLTESVGNLRAHIFLLTKEMKDSS